MAGKKGRSGPPGNLNAARFGLTSWLRRRALPMEKQHVAALVENYRAGLITAKGGKDAVTEVEAALIENAAKAFGAELLILEEAATRGLVRSLDGTWDLAPGLARLVGFLAVERQALVALGLDRRQREVPDLATYLKQRSAELAQQRSDEPLPPAEEPQTDTEAHDES